MSNEYENMRTADIVAEALLDWKVDVIATSGPGAIHLLNGLYDAKADNTHVIALTGTTYSDLMNSSYKILEIKNSRIRNKY